MLQLAVEGGPAQHAAATPGQRRVLPLQGRDARDIKARGIHASVCALNQALKHPCRQRVNLTLGLLTWLLSREPANPGSRSAPAV